MTDPNISRALLDLQTLRNPPPVVATPKKHKSSKSISPTKQRKLIEACKLWVNGYSMNRASKAVGIAVHVLRSYLESTPGIIEIKKRGLEAIDRELVRSAIKDIKAQDKKRGKASFGELTIGLGTKIDKLRPPHTVGVVLDNRKVNVKFSKWHNPPFRRGK